jgi:hypothetical protein
MKSSAAEKGVGGNGQESDNDVGGKHGEVQ